MSEKRFIVETVEITDSDTDESRISEVITDTDITYSYENIEDVVDLLNEQSERIKSLEMELDLIANTKLFSRRKLEEENEKMKKQLEKIPKSIRKVWLE